MGSHPSNLCGNQREQHDTSQFSDSFDFGIENSLDTIQFSNFDKKLIHYKQNFPENEQEFDFDCFFKKQQTINKNNTNLKSCLKNSVSDKSQVQTKKVQFQKNKYCSSSKTTQRRRKIVQNVRRNYQDKLVQNNQINIDFICKKNTSPLTRLILKKNELIQLKNH